MLPRTIDETVPVVTQLSQLGILLLYLLILITTDCIVSGTSVVLNLKCQIYIALSYGKAVVFQEKLSNIVILEC